MVDLDNPVLIRQRAKGAASPPVRGHAARRVSKITERDSAHYDYCTNSFWG